MLETMPFELCMKIECQNASLYDTAAGKHLKNCPMKGEINILVSKHTQVPVLPNHLHFSIMIKLSTEQARNNIMCHIH
jgi:hypothetical protein